MKRQIIILTAATLTLSGCGIYSKYTPVKEVPENLYGEEAMVADTTDNIGNLHWNEIFTDPQLQVLIKQGLKNNIDLASAQWRVKEAEATLLSAKLAYLPSFALAPQSTISSFDGTKASKTYSVPVSASWELDIFGRIRNAKHQAKALLEQSNDYRQAVQTQLISSIANTYYTLLMLDEQVTISEQTEQSWKETVNATRALMDAGLSNEAAVSQMEATYYNICTSILDLKKQINQVENSLSLLLAEAPHSIERTRTNVQVPHSLTMQDNLFMNNPNDSNIRNNLYRNQGEGTFRDEKRIPSNGKEILNLPEQFSVGIPVQILANRPDVRSAEHSLEAAFYATNQARSAFYPSITLNGSAGWTNSAGNAIFNPGKFLWSAIGSLTQPLFNRGTNIAQLNIAKAQQEEAKLSFHQALLNAGTEVNEALVQYHIAKKKADLYEQQIRSLDKAYESTSLLMQHGPTNYLEVLTARQTLLNAQLMQVANRFDEIQGIINLYQALGGGRD